MNASGVACLESKVKQRVLFSGGMKTGPFLVTGLDIIAPKFSDEFRNSCRFGQAVSSNLNLIMIVDVIYIRIGFLTIPNPAICLNFGKSLMGQRFVNPAS